MNKLSELSKEQMSVLMSKLRVGTCPNCGCAEKKTSSDEIYQVLSLNMLEDGLALKQPLSYMPLVACSCPKCGYTSFYNLRSLGVL